MSQYKERILDENQELWNIKDTLLSQRKKTKRKLLLWYVLAVFGLFLAMAGIPIFSRIIVSLVALVYINYSFQSKALGAIVANTIVLTLFNPLALVVFDQSTWLLLDGIAALLLAYTWFSSSGVVEGLHPMQTPYKVGQHPKK
jgi:hypothetical protein